MRFIGQRHLDVLTLCPEMHLHGVFCLLVFFFYFVFSFKNISDNKLRILSGQTSVLSKITVRFLHTLLKSWICSRSAKCFSSASYTHRTHLCGELRTEHANISVTLCGWLQYHRLNGAILVLRDWHGMVQLVVPKSQVRWFEKTSLKDWHFFF